MAVLNNKQIDSLSPDVRVLELGCGQIKRVPHSVAVDFNPRSVADVIHDLNETPYPFEDNSFDVIIAEHVLEHLADLMKVIEELHRITRPGGILYVEVPHFSSCNFFTDPTHRHAFSSTSFDYFVPGEALHGFRYSTIEFRKRSVVLGPFDRAGRFRRLVHRWGNRSPGRFEQHWAFLFPTATINFELEVLKPH